MSDTKKKEPVFLKFAGEQDAELFAVVIRAVAEEAKDWNNTAGTPLCVKGTKEGHIIVTYKEGEL